jgi:hypothetical protein
LSKYINNGSSFEDLAQIGLVSKTHKFLNFKLKVNLTDVTAHVIACMMVERRKTTARQVLHVAAAVYYGPRMNYYAKKMFTFYDVFSALGYNYSQVSSSPAKFCGMKYLNL